MADGIEAVMAQAKAAAGDRDVQVRDEYVAQTAIEAGVLDEPTTPAQQHRDAMDPELCSTCWHRKWSWRSFG